MTILYVEIVIFVFILILIFIAYRQLLKSITKIRRSYPRRRVNETISLPELEEIRDRMRVEIESDRRSTVELKENCQSQLKDVGGIISQLIELHDLKKIQGKKF